MVVRTDQAGVKIQPFFYGLMTEQINHSYDGGLYGELIQNRILQDDYPQPRRGRGQPATAPMPVTTHPSTPPHWTVVVAGGGRGTIAIDTNDPVNTGALKKSLRLDIEAASEKERVGMVNDGFWGIPVKPNTEYQASFYATRRAGIFHGPLTVDIESNDDAKILASGTVADVGPAWKKYSLVLKTGDVAASSGNRFVISGTSKGQVWFTLVSLFPPTYKNRANGNRIDLREQRAGMKPGFLRFPGGNYLEGNSIAERFAWKDTIGALEDRPGHQSPWGYRSSDGLGLLEFLEWCEDLKMQPVVAVFAGYTLRGEKVSGEGLKPFVQEAVDEIEYCIGDQTTKWGQERAKDGHPEPFKVTYVEIGNEDNLEGRTGGFTYNDRFTQIYDAIKGKYPQLQLISTLSSNDRRNPLPRTPDVIDDHFYFRSLQEVLGRTHRYDNYDRSKPKIFVGEWATRVGNPTPSMAAALGDAAWLTGLERNADVVIMNSYAPLLVHVGPGAMQWPTDLIGYDAGSSFGSPSYYVEKMFSENQGDEAMPVEVSGAAEMPPMSTGGATSQPTTRPTESIYAVANRMDESGDIILKVVNTLAEAQTMEIVLKGMTDVKTEVKKDGTVWVLSGELTDVNTIDEPEKVVPKQVEIHDAGATFTHEFPGRSVSVIRLKTK